MCLLKNTDFPSKQIIFMGNGITAIYLGHIRVLLT